MTRFPFGQKIIAPRTGRSRAGAGRCSASFGGGRNTSQQEKLVVRAHVDQVRHAVGQREKCGDAADVPDVLRAEAMAAQDIVIRIGHGLGRAREFAREIQHRLLARGEVGLAMMDRHLVCNLRILRIDAQDGAVGDHAVRALVEPAGGDDDHFFLGFRQSGFPQHQRVVIREEGAKLVRPVRQRDEYVRKEPGLLLHFQHLVADVGGQVFEFRDRVFAY